MHILGRPGILLWSRQEVQHSWIRMMAATSRTAVKCSAWVTSTRGKGLMGLKEGNYGGGGGGRECF